MRLYVGNLPFATTEDELKELFAGFSSVKSVQLIIDRATGRSKGFGFVDMDDQDEAKKAIDELHESDVNGKNIIVNEARPKERRDDRSSFQRRRY